MKGVILCGGAGTRLGSLTETNNKHLLPIYSKPMCFYPIEILANAGIKEIALVVSGTHAGKFIELIKNGERFGLKSVSYLYQNKINGGIADALALAENFANNEKIAVILGDNTMDYDIKFHLEEFKYYSEGARIFLKEVPNASKFGVPKFNDKGEIEEIIEKPSSPPSNYAVIGTYFYDNKVFDYIRKCSPSARQELEVTDLNNLYLKDGKLSYRIIDAFWQDAGSVDNLYLANKYWAEKNGIYG